MPHPHVVSTFSIDRQCLPAPVNQEPTYNVWEASVSVAPLNFACAGIAKIREETRQWLTKWYASHWENNYWLKNTFLECTLKYPGCSFISWISQAIPSEPSESVYMISFPPPNNPWGFATKPTQFTNKQIDAVRYLHKFQSELMLAPSWNTGLGHLIQSWGTRGLIFLNRFCPLLQYSSVDLDSN